MRKSAMPGSGRGGTPRCCATARTSVPSSISSSRRRNPQTMRPISVLFTNNALGARGGTETYVRDVALALLRQGHRPAAFSLVHGDVAAELRRATVPVLDDISRLGAAPDVIHG